jgi:cell division protein ZapA
MAQVTLNIGGNRYDLACRDGEEAHLEEIAAIVDKKAAEARSAVGSAGEVRQLLLASLLLADELDELRNRNGAPAPAPATSADDALLADIATRLESLATRLENRG